MVSVSLLLVIAGAIFSGASGQMVGTRPPPITPTCPSIDEIIKTMENLLNAQTRRFESMLTEMEDRLSKLTVCQPPKPVELSQNIYENLTISADWTLIYDQPYGQKLSSYDLKQAANKCTTDRVLVGALQNSNEKILTVAALGPTQVLRSNKPIDRPEKIGNVFWFSHSGYSFGFRPIDKSNGVILQPELYLNWNLDLNTGGWRAGVNTDLSQDFNWRKVIYCIPSSSHE